MSSYYVSFNAGMIVEADTPEEAVEMVKFKVLFVEGLDGQILVGTPVELEESHR